MKDADKIELLKEKFAGLIQAAMSGNADADATFIEFFTALKDQDAFWEHLQNEHRERLEAERERVQTALTDIDSKLSEMDVDKR